MEKQIVTKIISRTIIFMFVIFFLQVVLPLSVSAATGLNWDNPNANGNNPYKFKPQDVLNSQLIMQVVGCTGVVDKVSSAITGFIQGKASTAATELLNQKTADAEAAALIKTCQTGKKTGMTGVASIPNLSLTDVVGLIDCQTVTKTSDAKALAELIQTRKADAAAKTREECFNGIAYTLAKNQLTAMTRYTMNWVNSGFNGDPMYVRDITSFTNSLERNVLETGIKILTSPQKAYPYGSSFSRSAIYSYNSGRGLRSGAGNFLNSLTSDLSNFVTDPRSYYSETALERAQNANNLFASDFSTGGWNAWLSLTQIDQNNPLGFAMQASQYLADQQSSQIQNTKDELLTNNGFLSQKKCVLWNKIDTSDQYILNRDGTISTTTNPQSQDECIKYEVVTPGSIIKDKITTYVNSPERQLELADTINESLNSLFTALIAKFQNQGLASLSSEKYVYSNTNMGGGFGSNSIDLSTDGTGSGYANGSFDLTHDLGNTFIHSYQKASLGKWDAKSNIPELNIGVGPVSADGKPLANVYYIVQKPGNTKLFENGYNGWSVGDRAFWNGSEWQNWKAGTTNPIAKRGVIQIQKDYVVAAKEILMTLPNIMPKIGELDYCIPGPNPNWSATSSEAESAFTEFASTLTSAYNKGAFLKRASSTYSIASQGDSEYDNYYNIFKGTATSWWRAITSSHYWNGLISLGSMGKIKNNKNEAAAQARIDNLLEKINNDTRTFYDVYGNYINNLYGAKSSMQKQFLEYENLIQTYQNPDWLPMVSEGLDITKNIVSYNDDIVTAANGYRDAIVKANSNINKLTLIKNEVSSIIQAAQKRRDASVLKTLAEEAARNRTPLLTEAQYKAKYATCFAEEDIVYYDDLSIMGDTGGDESLRCNDGIDNDLDGLIDELDPDCGNWTPPAEPNYACILDLTEIPGTDEDGNDTTAPFMKDDTGADPIPNDNSYCTERTTSSGCTSSLYYNNGLGMKCRWVGGN